VLTLAILQFRKLPLPAFYCPSATDYASA